MTMVGITFTYPLSGNGLLINHYITTTSNGNMAICHGDSVERLIQDNLMLAQIKIQLWLEGITCDVASAAVSTTAARQSASCG